jgi:lysophospholipase L1-like esterase
MMMKRQLMMLLVLMVTVAAQAQTTAAATQPLTVELNKWSKKPFYYSVAVPDGNYKVTVTLGSKRRAGKTVVRAESRRLMVEEVPTRKGRFETRTFVVSKRSPRIDDLRVVKIKQRERGTRNWDDSLTLEFNGAAPAVQRITIEPDTAAVTVFLCGNSTVVDQNEEPWASWGQMIPRWFDERVCISNHAESGLTARTFLDSNRLDKILEMMRPGDWVMCEFGHNDEKEKRPGDGAWYHYVYNLKIFIDRVRAKGGHLVLLTPTQRRFFDDSKTKIKDTHGDFPAAMKMVAEREKVPVIDLNSMTRDFFETLGYEGSKQALVHYPANTFPGQDLPLADNTHFNPYGAYEVAKMVVMGMMENRLPILEGLRNDWKDFNPKQPDNPDSWHWYPAPVIDMKKPDGN